MVQDQLVDYISSQMKLGVSRDAIKGALVSAGWVAADVDDTFKKIGGGGSSPVSSSAKPAAMDGAASEKTGGPQMIRVSDLVSTSPAAFFSAASSGANANINASMKSQTFRAADADSYTAPQDGWLGNKKMLIGGIVAGILILALAGLVWYFNSENSGLTEKIASMTGATSATNSQLAALQSQFDASNTAISAQIAALTTANADLALNLSFFAVPVGGVSGTAASPASVTVTGSLLLAGKVGYFITTPRGAKIAITNANDPKIAAGLKPLVGHTVQIAGTYIMGSPKMTVSSVIDLSPAPSQPASALTPTAPASSTATSTAAH